MTAPDIWGPNVWALLHTLTFDFQGDHERFFNNLSDVLPCYKCSHNYYDHLKMLPVPKKKKDLPLWLIRIHNRVNIVTEKPIADEKKMLAFWKKERKNMHVYADQVKPFIGYKHKAFWKTVEENLSHHTL